MPIRQTATDNVSLETTETQTLTVVDTTDPNYSDVPRIITVKCHDTLTIPIIGLGGVTANDNCDTNVTIVFTEKINNNACGSTIDTRCTASVDRSNAVNER